MTHADFKKAKEKVMFKKKEGVPEGLYMWDSSATLEALAFVICLNGPRMFAYYSIFFLLETHNSNNSYPITTPWIYEMAAMSQELKMRLNAGCLCAGVDMYDYS